MRFLLLTLSLLVLPFSAYALNGVFTMQGVKQTNYLAESDGRYIVVYHLDAKKRTSNKNKRSLNLVLNKTRAKELLNYEDGTMNFAQGGISIKFKTAYYYQGNLYLQNVFGNIGSRNLNSREMKYDPKSKSLSSEHIIFEDDKKFSVKRNFYISVLDKHDKG